MENELKKKNNIGVIIIIIILSLLVIILGYYFVTHEFLNNDIEESEKNNISNTPIQETKEKSEIEYKFDVEKIVNKDTTYNYSLDDTNKNADIISYNKISYEKTTNGYKFCYDNNCKELNGEFTTIVVTEIFKGGQAVGDGYDFLISKTGDLYYANEVDTGEIETGVISQIKDVVKLYIVNLTSDRPLSPDGLTVIAQTKDGSLYDIYEYVKQY